MSKKTKRLLSVAAAVAVPFVAPAAAGFLFKSAAGWLASGATGAVLGAGVASAAGGSGADIRRGALMGGIGSGLSSYMQGASAFAEAPKPSVPQSPAPASTVSEGAVPRGTPGLIPEMSPAPTQTVAGLSPSISPVMAPGAAATAPVTGVPASVILQPTAGTAQATGLAGGAGAGAGTNVGDLTFGQYMAQPSTYVPLAIQTGIGVYGAQQAEEQQKQMEELAQQQMAANEAARQDQLREYAIRNQMADAMALTAPTGGEYAKQAETATRLAGTTATEQATREAMLQPGGSRRRAGIEAMRRRGEIASALGGARAGAEGYAQGEAARRQVLTTAAGMRGTPPAGVSYEAMRQAYAGRGDAGDMLASAGQFVGGLTSGFREAQERQEDRRFQQDYLDAIRGGSPRA